MCGVGGVAKGKYGDAFIYSIHAKAITRQLTCLLLPLFTFLLQGKRLGVKAIRLVFFFVILSTTQQMQKKKRITETKPQKVRWIFHYAKKEEEEAKICKGQPKQTNQKQKATKQKTFYVAIWILMFSPHSLQNKTKKTKNINNHSFFFLLFLPRPPPSPALCLFLLSFAYSSLTS